MDHIKKIARSTRNFVEDHKVGITVVLTAATCLKINRVALRQHDEFLKEHDLYEKFYTPEED
jgi:hypothetical protein